MAVPKKARTTTKNSGSMNAANPKANGNVTSIESAQQQVPEDFAELVRRRAYEIYEESGRPDGCDFKSDFWRDCAFRLRVHGGRGQNAGDGSQGYD